MKEQMLKIAKDLEQGTITETEAHNLLLGLFDVSGLACKCGNKTFTHRHSNWIECTVCNKIQVLQA